MSLVLALFGARCAAFQTHTNLALENLALRQQLALLQNHLADLVSVDFFVVPTATFRVLYVFVILLHHRRRVVHFNVSETPTAAWTAQQIVEAFPDDSAPHYLLPIAMAPTATSSDNE